MTASDLETLSFAAVHESKVSLKQIMAKKTTKKRKRNPSASHIHEQKHIKQKFKEWEISKRQGSGT